MTSLAGGGDLGDLKELASLDLHNNQLEKLPDEIGKLVNLRVSSFYIDFHFYFLIGNFRIVKYIKKGIMRVIVLKTILTIHIFFQITLTTFK